MENGAQGTLSRGHMSPYVIKFSLDSVNGHLPLACKCHEVRTLFAWFTATASPSI